MFGKKDSGAGDSEMATCKKCSKQKKKSDGVCVLDGSTFCCKDCCGDAAKGEHNEKKDNVCEVC